MTYNKLQKKLYKFGSFIFRNAIDKYEVVAIGFIVQSRQRDLDTRGDKMASVTVNSRNTRNNLLWGAKCYVRGSNLLNL